MTNRTLENIRKDAEELEQESILLDLHGQKQDAAEKAENAMFKMETVAKSRNLPSDYTQLVSYCWNYLVIVQRPCSEEDTSDLVAEKAIKAQETAYSLSQTLHEKSNLAGVYRDVCIFRKTGILDSVRKAVQLAEEIVRERGEGQDYRLLGTCYSRMGLVLFAEGQRKDAEQYLNQALEILTKIDANETWNHIELSRARMYQALVYSSEDKDTLAKETLTACLSDLDLCYRTCREDTYYPALFLTCSNLIRFCELAGYGEEAKQSVQLAVRIYNDQIHNRQFSVNESEIQFVQDRYTRVVANRVNELGQEKMSHGEWQNARDLFHLEVYLRGNISEGNKTKEDERQLIQSYAHMAKANQSC